MRGRRSRCRGWRADLPSDRRPVKGGLIKPEYPCSRSRISWSTSRGRSARDFGSIELFTVVLTGKGFMTRVIPVYGPEATILDAIGSEWTRLVLVYSRELTEAPESSPASELADEPSFDLILDDLVQACELSTQLEPTGRPQRCVPPRSEAALRERLAKPSHSFRSRRRSRDAHPPPDRGIGRLKRRTALL